jgi:gas vesicle protein GvpL/GvpF
MAVENPPRTGAGGVTTTALYCYGVTSADAAMSQLDAGLAGTPVEPVRLGDLAALTSPVPSRKIRARRADLLCHFDVLANAFEHGTVLPLRFGIVFDDEKSLTESFLRPRQDELVGLLRELRDRVELRVTAHYREEAILAEVVRENPRVERLREATRGERGPAHPLLLELGELVAAELLARTDADVRAILERLRRLAVDYELDEEPIEHQVLRASFLVDRKRVAAFDKTMDEIASEQAGRIDFKYVGPLPPHSFVNVTHGERG